ncbi:MAG: hypothetical protein ACNA8W_10560, partial [Bradymonadaceae bacterium]
PFWIDDDRLLYVREKDEHFQAFVSVPVTGTEQIITAAPYIAYNPRPHGESVRFLNREGFRWTLDEVALPAIPEVVEGEMSSSGAISAEWGGGSSVSPPTVEGYRKLRPPRLRSDAPYSKLDGLFFPRLRVPFVGITRVTGDTDELQFFASLDISGMDELGFHSWAVSGLYEFTDQYLSWNVGYANMQLAPLVVLLNAYDNWTQLWIGPVDEESTTSFRRRDRGLQLNFFRIFYDIPITLGLLALEEEEFDVINPQRRRFVGTQFATAYGAGRGTAYGGTQRLLSSSVNASFFPEQVGSDFSLGDLRNQTAVHLPLPFSNRHRLRLSARARGLLGVPEGFQLMRVGGFADSPLFVSQDSVIQPIARGLLPGPLRFTERLRGFEDLGLATNQAILGDLNYRFPFIVDRGSATSLWMFPASFLSQFNFEIFASGATLLDGELHAAAGASLDMNFQLWLIPFQIRYQIAQRLTDDQALVHTVLLGAGGE